MNNILPHSIQQDHIVVFDLLAQKRLNQLQKDAILVYLIDHVDSSALYWLAKQFDLLGFNGWKLADTDEKKRALIKKGIELHRYKGTVWSVKEALKSVGFSDATITEHVSHWAGFTVQLNAGDAVISEQQIAEALELVKAYKNVRSHLMGFEFKIEFDDAITVSDTSFEAPGSLYEDGLFIGSNFVYDGTYSYNGTKNYNSDEDLLELTII